MIMLTMTQLIAKIAKNAKIMNVTFLLKATIGMLKKSLLIFMSYNCISK